MERGIVCVWWGRGRKKADRKHRRGRAREKVGPNDGKRCCTVASQGVPHLMKSGVEAGKSSVHVTRSLLAKLLRTPLRMGFSSFVNAMHMSMPLKYLGMQSSVTDMCTLTSGCVSPHPHHVVRMVVGCGASDTRAFTVLA